MIGKKERKSFYFKLDYLGRRFILSAVFSFLFFLLLSTEVLAADGLMNGKMITGETDNHLFWLQTYDETTSPYYFDHFFVNKTGNVGIGTTNPTQKLNVSGNIIMNNGYSLMANISGLERNLIKFSNNQVKIGEETGYFQSIKFSLNQAENAMYIEDITGNVGIGTTAPSRKLHVAGDLQLDSVSYGVTPGSTQTLALSTVEYVNSKVGGSSGIAAGTSGQTLRHDGTGWVANSSLFNNGTNVGIGTSNPNEKLTINGSIRIGPTATDPTINTQLSANTLGIFAGMTARGGQIDFKGGSASSDPGTLIFRTGTGAGSVAQPERMRIDISGNVGIGTTNPNSKLHVSGDIEIPTTNRINFGNNSSSFPALKGVGNELQVKLADDSDYTAIKAQYFNSQSPSGIILKHQTYNVLAESSGMKLASSHSTRTLSFLIGDASTGTTVMRLSTDGNVGIGTTAPTQKLHIAGGAQLDGVSFGVTPGTTQTLGLTTVEYVNNMVSGVTQPTVGYWTANGTNINSANTGNVGIGIANPVAKLHVNGSARFSGLTGSTDNKVVSISDDGDLGFVDLSSTAIKEEAEYNVATTAYQTFLTSPGYVEEYYARFKITAKATASAISGNVMFVEVHGSKNYAPTITVRSAQNSTGANDSGIDYMRVAFPTTVNNGAPVHVEFNTGSVANRYVKVEMIESHNLNLLQEVNGSLYNSANQTLNNPRIYYNGTIVNKTIYGNISGSAGSAGYSTYTNYGSYAGYTISNGTDKTNQWTYVGNIYLGYNSTYRFGQSWNVNLMLKELTNNTDRTQDELDTAKIILKGSMPTVANTTEFNNTVPSFSAELHGDTVLNPDDIALRVESSSTSNKYIRLYVRLKSPNTHYSLVPENRYGASYSSTGVASMSYCYYNYVTAQVPVASLPAPVQGSIVYATKGYSPDTFWRPNGNDLFNINSGNIGIGTTSPSRKLHVTGDLQLDSVSFGVTPGESQALALSTVEYVNSKVGGSGGITTGTTGQTLRHDGTSWVANSNLYNNGTNVGIGTTNPSEKLAVNGNGYFSGDLNVSTNGASFVTPRVLGMTDLSLNEAARWQFGDAANAIQNGYGQAMDIYSYHTLRLMGDRATLDPPTFSTESDIGVHVINRISGSTALKVQGAPSQFADYLQISTNGTTNGDILTVNGSGNVGIGTTNPGYKLTVAGSVYGYDFQAGGATNLSGNLLRTSVGDLTFSAGSNSGQISNLIFKTNNAGTLTEHMRIDPSGNVGIGTTTPSRKLHVAGDMQLDAVSFGVTPGSSQSLALTTVEYVNNVVTGVSNPTVGYWTASGNNIFNANTANVGIGSTAPGNKLDVSGSLGVNGIFKGYGSANGSFFEGKLGINSLSAGASSLAVFGNATVGTSYLSTVAPTNGLLVQGNVGIGITNPSESLHVANSVRIGGGLTLAGNLNMTGSTLIVNKITANTIDPLYTINGIKYSTFAPSIVGGVKEEYVGQIRKEEFRRVGNEYEKVIDFAREKEGSDLWVWRKTVDFNTDNVEVFITPKGQAAMVYAYVEGNKVVIRSDRMTDAYVRLVGKRYDWRMWPTKAEDQNQEGGLFID